MKAIVLVLGLAAIPSIARAMDLPVRLRDGATWTQTSVHTRADVRGGATSSLTATSVIKATYRKDGAVGTLRQDFISFDVEGVKAEEMKSLAEQAKMIYPAVLEVDEALQPVRVRDWDRVRELIFAAVGRSADTPSAVESVKAMFGRMSDTQAAALFREQGLVALGQGGDLEVGETRTYDSEVANTMGGPAIRATGAFRLDSFDKTKGLAVITWKQQPDSTSLAASLKVSLDAIVARVAPEEQAEARRQFATMTLERRETCRYEVHVATGLATTTDCTVEMKSGLKDQLAQRTDRWLITQSLPEPR